MKINWNAITSLAYLKLIKLDIKTFPISTKKIKCDGTIISSYQKYAQSTGMTVDSLNFGGELQDAFIVSNLPNMPKNLTIILYDDNKSDTRAKHSLLHEVGHVKCNHKTHDSKEEIEAHFFATQANAPNILVKALSERGYPINTSSIMIYFGLSEPSAKKKMKYLNKYYFNHSNKYDDVMLTQFTEFLDINYPPKTKHFNDSYYEELENNRKNWY